MHTIFFGSSQFVLPIITLLKDKFDLVLVVTTETNLTDAVPAYCIKNNIEYVSVSQFDEDLTSSIINHKSSLGVLAYFGLILPKEILDIFPKGILNVHPSLLPHYRGATPGQSAMVNGDTVSGVSIIKLDEKMDHGPILAQEEEKILPTDIAETFYTRAFTKGATLLAKNIPLYLEDKLQLKEQDHTKATFTKPFTRQDGYIDSTNPLTPETIDHMIRAYYPWPGVWTRLQIHDSGFKIVKLLPEQKLQMEGKKPVSLRDFLNGYPETAKQILPLLKK